ncbi:hypothetical protein GA707_07340 [Nostocoides sp. F2B08]|uniref:hypothetical protein n=1 Tax=Nostocoides sp. F2B08 TaxID=2653936 RepID=UPI001263A93D|nr:hypothetical protein [Tetrasphaera sp. F2B08]KAB7745707.1 hypothetical protein GA707_07340 [Tetrasphaera sp. F2B08]
MNDPATGELMQGLRRSLRSGDPATFLVDASAIVALAEATDADLPEDWVGLMEAFAEIDIAETTALLHVASAFAGDDLHRRRLQRILAMRRQPMPGYVTGLGEAEVTTAYFMGDELGDGDNIILGIDFPDGTAMTAIAYIDHNMGTIVKDGFFIGEHIEVVRERYIELIREQGDSTSELPPMGLGEARDRIEEALENLDRLHPDWEQDGWPLARPLLELLVATMPEPDERTTSPLLDASDCERAFWASPEGAELERESAIMDAVGELLEFAEEHWRDPLRWSPVAVEVCVRELAFDVTVSDGAVEEFPRVLPRIVRFAHRTRGISPGRTAETLAAVEEWLPVLQASRATGITAALRQSNELYDAAMAGDLGPLMRHRLVGTLGSDEAVVALDDVPHPDEELDLSPVPEDLHERVSAISAHLDRLCAAGLANLDVEFRTVCRRFLVGIAARAPEVLRRRAKDINTASAIAWLLARENNLIGGPPQRVRAQTIAEVIGAPSNSDRAQSLRSAFTGARNKYLDSHALGAPILVSRYRRELMEQREQYW